MAARSPASAALNCRAGWPNQRAMHPALSRVAALAFVVASACTGGGPRSGAVISELGSPTVSADLSVYQPAQPITVAWTDMPGNLDWVAIAPDGSDLLTVSHWAYTGGAAAGTTTFTTGEVPGSYVARAFTNDGYDLVVESAAFTVSAVAISTDQASYFPGQAIAVTWAGLPGNAHDWVALAPQGSAPTAVISWLYTGGATGGTQTQPGISATGSYVARTFIDDSYTIISESTPFTVTGGSATITTDASTYTANRGVVITWSGLAGSATDWIAIAQAGAALDSIERWVYTGGGTSGSLTLEPPSALGSYTARAFSNGTYTMAGESAAFAVAAASASVSADAATYGAGQDITVSWTGMQGVAGDWIGLAPAGSPATTVARWVYAGTGAGSTTFLTGLPDLGSYVARLYSNDTYNIVSESSAFDVQ